MCCIVVDNWLLLVCVSVYVVVLLFDNWLLLMYVSVYVVVLLLTIGCCWCCREIADLIDKDTVENLRNVIPKVTF